MSPNHPDATTLVLHAVRLGRGESADTVAARFDLDAERVAMILDDAAVSGWVQFRTGRFGGWNLTTAGRAHGERLLRDELDRAGTGERIDADYLRFRGLNPELLSICTDWQVVERGGIQVPNPHDDDQHDAMVVERLRSLHRRTIDVVDSLAEALDRFDGYADRLANALDLVVTGSVDWLTRPTVDSYHTVWFELHEDLLATTGRTRADERAADGVADAHSSRRTA
jgi:hypothetical protein